MGSTDTGGQNSRSRGSHKQAVSELDIVGGEEIPPRGGRPSRGRQAVAIMVGVLVVVVGGIAGVLGMLQHRITSHLEYIDDPFDTLTNRPIEDAPASGELAPLNVLLLGSDSRISAGDPGQWEYGAQRTDAIMLVHISGDRESVQVMSIPRDSWVPIPGHGTNKINAAYSFGGPPLMIETVEQLTGVRIDHFAIADFESFAALTDSLGGVEINVGTAFVGHGVRLEAGPQVLTGEQALAYVRERYELPGGDFDRVKRQQNWIRAILRSTFERDVLTDPFALTSLLETAASAVMVDENLSVGTMRSLALSMRDVRPGDLTFLTVPLDGTGWSEDGQSIVLLDQEPFDALMDAVATDTVADHIRDNPGLDLLGGSGDVR
ncbi:LCP family protein [Pseudactinotalea suaedae]|uniref:LCP family protein n=1 Tax=Pseudactinotalea suaedae TaxID=1524924 RepID=UPI001F4F5364|nr:LCP family protein [Pseudactinotalea suaedae]